MLSGRIFPRRQVWPTAFFRLTTTITLAIVSLAAYDLIPEFRNSPWIFVSSVLLFGLLGIGVHDLAYRNADALPKRNPVMDSSETESSVQLSNLFESVLAIRNRLETFPQFRFDQADEIRDLEKRLLVRISELQDTFQKMLERSENEDRPHLVEILLKQQAIIRNMEVSLNRIAAEVAPSALSMYWASSTALAAKRNAIIHQHPQDMTSFVREASGRTISILTSDPISSGLLSRAFSDFGFRVDMRLHSIDHPLDLPSELKRLVREGISVLLFDEYSLRTYQLAPLKQELQRHAGHAVMVEMFDALAREPEKLQQTLRGFFGNRHTLIVEQLMDEVQMAAVYTSLVKTEMKK
jgi:hypothetical protein